MSAAALIETTKYPAWEEDQPPRFPERPKVGLSVKQQWICIATFWIVIIPWAVVFSMDTFTNTPYGFFVNNIVPALPFIFLGIPTACSLIGYFPPRTALICFFLIIAAPFIMATWKAAFPTLVGYFICVVMSFMFMAIHKGNAATEDADGSTATDFNLSFLQPMAMAYANGLLYLWQFSIHCPLNYKVRYLIIVYSYTKAACVGAKEQITGTAKKYDDKEFRTYKLNDVQYIRIQSIRVMILMCMFSIGRILEETYCPTQTVTIDGALFTWGDYKFHPFKYDKDIPVCEW